MPPPISKPVGIDAGTAQFATAIAIVAVLGIIAIALIIAGVVTKNWVIVSGTIGTVVGALGTALNAPTGITKVMEKAVNGKVS